MHDRPTRDRRTRLRRRARALALAGLAAAAACSKPAAPAEVLTGHAWRWTSGPAKGAVYAFGAGQQFNVRVPGRPEMFGTWEAPTPAAVHVTAEGYLPRVTIDTRFDVTALSDDRVVFARGTAADTLERVDGAR